jgi:pyruvate/2-oxoglutarate dehydrogenase complex dihydrolipoamide dehydrogenase (E3) component
MANAYDAVLIGTGQAAPSLARRLSAAGMSIAVIERRLFGGTCVNTGCIPTKAMVASAYTAHLARVASSYGVVIDGDIRVDMKAVRERAQAMSRTSRASVETSLRGLKNCTVYTGHARFRSRREVVVGDVVLESDRVFINVGARASIPHLPGLDRVPYLTNSSMLDIGIVPPHLVILGGSYVGLEFGQMFRRFGSDVTIVERGPRLLGREDEDVSTAILEILRNEGIDVRLNAQVAEVSGGPGTIAVQLAGQDGTEAVRGSHLLIAVGRQPNTGDLALDSAGVARDDRGFIIVDDRLQTNVPGIWALGDCNGKGAFTHTAYNDFQVVAANLLDGDSRRVSDRIDTYALYIDPPLGRAGLTEAEARRRGHVVRVATLPMTRVGRAIEKGETNGFMKIVVDADTKHILGATILGTGGDEVIHSVLDLMYAKAPYTVLEKATHIHPTVSELLPTVLEQLSS